MCHQRRLVLQGPGQLRGPPILHTGEPGGEGISGVPIPRRQQVAEPARAPSGLSPELGPHLPTRLPLERRPGCGRPSAVSLRGARTPNLFWSCSKRPRCGDGVGRLGAVSGLSGRHVPVPRGGTGRAPRSPSLTRRPLSRPLCPSSGLALPGELPPAGELGVRQGAGPGLWVSPYGRVPSRPSATASARLWATRPLPP